MRAPLQNAISQLVKATPASEPWTASDIHEKGIAPIDESIAIILNAVVSKEIGETPYLINSLLGNLVSKEISAEPVDKARAILEEWLETPKEGDPMVDCLLGAITEAHAALADVGKPISGDLISREAALREIGVRHHLLRLQFEVLDISKEDGVYHICADVIRALPAVQIAGAA